jgi:excisionase family DNA binding protein
MTLEAAFEEIVRRVVREEVARSAPRPERVPDALLLRVRDVATMTGLSQRTIRDLIDRGQIPTRDVEPYNCILVARSDLDRWIDSLPTKRGEHDQKTA